MTRRSSAEIDAILDAAARATTDDCLFPLYTYRGLVRRLGRRMSAPRAVWTIAHGDPGDAFVLHTCHRGADGCLNIRHLYLGDHQRNMDDRQAVGHYSAGAENPAAKLTPDDVCAIRRRRAAGETLKSIAGDYGVHLSTIHLIVTGKKWATLDCH